MSDVLLSVAIVAVVGVLAVMVRGIRNETFPDWAMWITTTVCVVGWFVMLLTDWPWESLARFWVEHSVLASTLSSVLLIGVVFLTYERAEKRRQAELADKISGAGVGGIVDHLVDVEVALALLSAPVDPAQYAEDHWAGWDAPNKPLRWLRGGRIEILAAKTATATEISGQVGAVTVPVDPRRLREDLDAEWTPWGTELIDQSIRRLLAGMRDWNSLIGSSTKGTQLLLILSTIRQELMRLHDLYQQEPTRENRLAAGAKVLSLRAKVRVLAHYCEKEWSGAPTPRPEVLGDAHPLNPMPADAQWGFEGAEGLLREQLLRHASSMGFNHQLKTVDQVREFVRVAHIGQVDKLGRDYFHHHLLPVAAKLSQRGDVAEMAGLLHDVLEDAWVTVSDLEELGVPEAVISAVEAVTKRPNEPYEALIARSAEDALGVWVKLADNELNLESNSALARVDPQKAERLRLKYETARATLLAAAASQGAVSVARAASSREASGFGSRGSTPSPE